MKLAIVLLVSTAALAGCKSKPVTDFGKWDKSLPHCCSDRAVKATEDPNHPGMYVWHDCALVASFPRIGKVPAQNLFRCEDGSLAMQDAKTTFWVWRPK